MRAFLVGLAFIAGLTTIAEALRGYAEAKSDGVLHPPAESARWTDAQWGGYLVQAGDLGLLTTDNLRVNAVPWKLFRALPDVVPEPFFANPQHGWKPDATQPFKRWGFITGAIDGPPGLVHAARDADTPIGYVRGLAKRKLPTVELELGATACSACHVGHTWDASGQPTAQTWWGVPNHALDLGGLVDAVEAAALDPRATDAALLAAIRKRFPDTSKDELHTYEKYVIPKFKESVRAAHQRWGKPHPWQFGGPGFSHGAAVLHELLADKPEKLKPADFPPAYVKIPNVYAVTTKRRLLIDGDYVARDEPNQDEVFVDHLVGFLPVLGASPKRAVEERPHLAQIREFLKALEPPKFPGPIDAARAKAGATTYAARCQVCHGNLDASGHYAYPGTALVPVATIGTDATRANAVTPELLRAFNDTAVGKVMHAEHTGAYAPPPLHGVWSQAPYLHNGSVPTLWALMNPNARPVTFWTGALPLDLEKVGLGELKPDFVPTAEPKLFDTREPGRSNQGHAAQFEGLSDDEKRSLLEYLKTL